MDIEDDDSNSNSNIYVNTPVVPPSTHPLSTLARPTQLPHRSSLLSQFNQPVSLCFVVCLFVRFILIFLCAYCAGDDLLSHINFSVQFLIAVCSCCL